MSQITPGDPLGGPHHLDRSLVHGIAWTAGLKWFTQVLSWASTLVVARILTPGDYGLVGMATVYLGLVQLVNEFGLGAAIVQSRDLSEDQIARLGGLSALLGVFFCLLSVALAWPIAGFFGEPAVAWIIVVLSATFITSAFQVLPRALLQRDLEFRRLAWIDGLEAIALTVATVLFAVFGFRYWALVLGGIVGRTAGTAIALASRGHRLAWPRRFRTIFGEVTFGGQLVVSRLAWYVYSNADTTVVGRVLGKAALGAYNIGWTIASIPVDRISGMVARVTPAVFSAVQKDLPALRRYLLGLSEGMALITFPVSAGMALVAEEFVIVALGDKWRPAIVPLQLLALYGGFRSIATLLPQILVVTGHSRRSMEMNLIAALVLPVVFYVGSRWGTTGVALGWIIGYPIVVIPLFFRSAFRAIALPATEYLHALWPALSSTFAMAMAVTAVRALAPARLTPAILLALLVLTGAAAYAGTLFAAHRRRLRDFLALWRRIRQ